jgi:hypothetical protein
MHIYVINNNRADSGEGDATVSRRAAGTRCRLGNEKRNAITDLCHRMRNIPLSNGGSDIRNHSLTPGGTKLREACHSADSLYGHARVRLRHLFRPQYVLMVHNTRMTRIGAVGVRTKALARMNLLPARRSPAPFSIVMAGTSHALAIEEPLGLGGPVSR